MRRTRIAVATWAIVVFLAVWLLLYVSGFAGTAFIFTYPKFKATNPTTGVAMSGGLLYFYEPGTTTLKNTYTTPTMSAANTNPVVLDANGEATIYLSGFYDVKLTDSIGTSQWTMEDIEGMNAFTVPVYEIDVISDYGGGTTCTKAILDNAVAAVGLTTKTTLLLRSCTWAITANADYSAYTNITFKVMNGAILSHGTYTLNIPNVITEGQYQIFSGTGTVSGLKESYPEWWGIDGTADNTEITYAANSLSSGGILHLDTTTYNIADIVYLPDYITVRGKGYNSVLKATADLGDNPILRTSNKTGIIIENLRIDGNRAYNTIATQYAHAVSFTYAKKSAVRNCWLDNNVGDGVYIGEGSEDIEVVDNFMYDNYRNGVSDVGGYRHIIERNIIVSASSNIVGCIDLEPNSDVALQDILVKGNICYITGTKPYGIDIALDAVTTDSNLKNILITDNIIHGDGTNGPTVGIYGHGARNVDLSKNEVYSPEQDGIILDDGAVNASAHCSIDGDRVSNASRYGIESKADNTPIRNTKIYAVAGSTMTHGTYVRGVSGLIYTGNDVYIPSISGTTTYAFLAETGTTTDFIIADNRFYSDTVDGNYGVWLANATFGQVYGNSFKNFAAGTTLAKTATDSVWVHDNNYAGCTTNFVNSSRTVIGTITLSTKGTSLLYSAAGAVTATLPDGDEPGTIKIIKMSNATATSTVSVTHHETSDPEEFQFGAVTDILVLMWNGLEWVTINNQGVAVP